MLSIVVLSCYVAVKVILLTLLLRPLSILYMLSMRMRECGNRLSFICKMYSPILSSCWCLPDSDSGSLLKIQDAVHSCRRLIELKNSHCKSLLGKLGAVENEVSGLHKKLSDAEHEKIKQEQELCNLRYDISMLMMSKG